MLPSWCRGSIWIWAQKRRRTGRGFRACSAACVCVCALASVSEEPTEEPFSRRRTSHANGSPRSRGIREYCDIFASIPENHRKAINGVKCEQQYFGEKKTNKKGATKKKRERKTGEHLWINSGKVRRFFSINWWPWISESSPARSPSSATLSEDEAAVDDDPPRPTGGSDTVSRSMRWVNTQLQALSVYIKRWRWNDGFVGWKKLRRTMKRPRRDPPISCRNWKCSVFVGPLRENVSYSIFEGSVLSELIKRPGNGKRRSFLTIPFHIGHRWKKNLRNMLLSIGLLFVKPIFDRKRDGTLLKIFRVF